jgi:endonuclease/exonuclease/phosphatase family metal-dependent hydrolase
LHALGMNDRLASTASIRANDGGNAGEYLRLASFNIQTGIHTSCYREYITHSWQHIWPTDSRMRNLDRIAQMLRQFDVVGLQEVDGGGVRSHNVVQTEYLARHAGFPFWCNQINRRIGNLALHSNGLLSRLQPAFIHDYKLPGLPGRGALIARFGEHSQRSLYLCVMHLALSRQARLRQISFIGELIRDLPYVVLMGDLNFEPNSREMKKLVGATNLCDPSRELKTFPSWRPHRMLDHILVTPSLQVKSIRVINFTCSDHLPISMDIQWPSFLKPLEARV